MQTPYDNTALRKLFDEQIRTLNTRRCPPTIVERLAEQKTEVLARVRTLQLHPQHIPFLPVIPRCYRSIYDQLSMIRIGRRVGYTYLRPSGVLDLIDTPCEPCYIYAVEDGEETPATSRQDSQTFVDGRARRGLTEIEVISLCLHTDVLSRHNLIASGSTYLSIRVPDLWLTESRIELGWLYIDDVIDGWRVPSCAIPEFCSSVTSPSSR